MKKLRLPIRPPWYTQPIRVTSGYRSSHRPGHNGIDIGVPTCTALHAPAAGTVVSVWRDGVGRGKVNGNGVRIRHENGLYSVCLHMHRVTVSEGQSVGPDQLIGYTGNTGRSEAPHLHFMVEKGAPGQDVNPLDHINAAGQRLTGADTGRPLAPKDFPPTPDCGPADSGASDSDSASGGGSSLGWIALGLAALWAWKERG